MSTAEIYEDLAANYRGNARTWLHFARDGDATSVVRSALESRRANLLALCLSTKAALCRIDERNHETHRLCGGAVQGVPAGASTSAGGAS
jgi:hypothetical protein